ncbi:hypothetical protein GCM10027347_51620 [Larkinella harenae]
MAAGWKLLPPLRDDDLPRADYGALVRKDFDIVNHSSEFEVLTGLHWTKLSRQEVSNLRSLTDSTELRNLLSSYGYGISRGTIIDIHSEEDPNDAEFDLMISSKEDIPQELMDEIMGFVKRYRVQ